MIKLLSVFILLIANLAHASEETQWTYAFYLASGEGFYREQNNNFLEICKGAKSVTNGKVVIFIDVEPEKGKISSLKLKRGTYAFEVESGNQAKQIEIPSLELGTKKAINLDSSNPDVIKNFFGHVKKNYRSRNYFYSITAHGDVLINPVQGAINSINIAKALAGNKADVLALDMCYMGGLESLWDLRNSGTYIIAASTTIPLSVNDYSIFLRNAGRQNHAPVDVASDFVAAYSETYAQKRYPISIFVLESGKGFERFVDAFNQSAPSFLKELDSFDKIKPARSSKSNLYGTNADLLKGIDIPGYTGLKTKLNASIVSSFAVNTEFSGPALFLPKDSETYKKHRAQYLKTSFSIDNPNWAAFLDLFYTDK